MLLFNDAEGGRVYGLRQRYRYVKFYDANNEVAYERGRRY